MAQNGSLAARFGGAPPEPEEDESEDSEDKYWAMKVLSAECYGAGYVIMISICLILDVSPDYGGLT